MGDPADVLRIASHREGRRGLIQLDGELDMHTAPTFTATVDELLANGVTVLEIDAGAVSFADSAGVHALLLARREVGDLRGSLRLAKVSDALDRVLGMTGLRDVLAAPGH